MKGVLQSCTVESMPILFLKRILYLKSFSQNELRAIFFIF